MDESIENFVQVCVPDHLDCKNLKGIQSQSIITRSYRIPESDFLSNRCSIVYAENTANSIKEESMDQAEYYGFKKDPFHL